MLDVPGYVCKLLCNLQKREKVDMMLNGNTCNKLDLNLERAFL